MRTKDPTPVIGPHKHGFCWLGWFLYVLVRVGLVPPPDSILNPSLSVQSASERVSQSVTKVGLELLGQLKREFLSNQYEPLLEILKNSSLSIHL